MFELIIILVEFFIIAYLIDRIIDRDRTIRNQEKELDDFREISSLDDDSEIEFIPTVSIPEE